MKSFKTLIAVTLSVITASATMADAQYYQIANALPSLISPALSGSMAYKGFVEVSGLGGIGVNRANFIGISTSQGFQYSSWFFMGAGIGVDIAMARNNENRTNPDTYSPYYNDNNADTVAMIPVVSDFRFSIPAGQAVSFYIDAKIGAAWFLGDDYLQLHDGSMGHGAQFFLQPSVGLRIPVNSSNSRQAINFGVTYRLLTSGNNYSWYDRTLTLNSFGASIAFEW